MMSWKTVKERIRKKIGDVDLRIVDIDGEENILCEIGLPHWNNLLLLKNGNSLEVFITAWSSISCIPYEIIEDNHRFYFDFKEVVENRNIIEKEMKEYEEDCELECIKELKEALEVLMEYAH